MTHSELLAKLQAIQLELVTLESDTSDALPDLTHVLNCISEATYQVDNAIDLLQ